MLRRALPTVALVVLTHAATAAAQRPQREAASFTRSLMAGGVVVGDSRLYLAKGSVARGRWALMLDLTRDATRERWNVDDSRGDYIAWGASAQLRRYSREDALGWFLEGGAGSARAALKVQGGDLAERRTGNVALGTWGAGARVGVGGAAFLELGYRGIVVLTERHLYTDDAPPPGSTDDFVTYRSWYFKRGRSTGQPYAGVGLRF